MQFKAEEEVGREAGDCSCICQIFCFAIHGRSLLIPTDGKASLAKPKQTHLCPPGPESLSCLKFRYSSAHPILAIMNRETYYSFASSSVSRRQDQCLSLVSLNYLLSAPSPYRFHQMQSSKGNHIPHTITGHQ